MKKAITKLESLLFYSLVLFIPTQLGKHFWPDFSYIQGIRIDYLSPTIYLTDVLIGLLFVSWLIRILSQRPEKKSKVKSQKSKAQFKIQKYSPFLIAIFVICYLLLVIVLSERIMGGLYSLLKLLEMAFVGYYSAKFITGKKVFSKIIIFLGIGGIFESMLALAQFVNHGSLGGLLYFLGERAFNSGTPGIANASLNGELVLRPYGTLPHPNVLAGYLLMVLILTLFTLHQAEKSVSKIIKISVLLIASIALLLTMSRIALILWIIIFGYYFLNKVKINKYFLLAPLVIMFIFLTPLGSRFSQISLKEEAVVQRSILNEKAIQMISHNPLLGVGLGNFLPTLSAIQKPLSSSTYLQPVHNIFLLIAAEIGIIGLAIFLWFQWKTFKATNGKWQMANGILVCFLAIIILGLFDHYWLTLQQGQLLFAFITGLCWLSLKK